MAAHPTRHRAPPRDELIIKVLVSLRLPGVDLHEVLQVHRRHFVEAMQHCTHIKSKADDDDIELALVADAELFRLDAVVRWLDAADARLKRRPIPEPGAAPLAAPTRITEVDGVGMTAVIELRGVTKVYGEGASRGAGPRPRRPDGVVRRARRGDGSERVGQEHVADHRRQSRGSQRGLSADRWPRPGGDVAQRPGTDASSLDRVRVPGLQPPRRTDGV